MKKPVLVVPRNQAREMIPNDDLARMLASGSWLVAVKPKPRTRDAKAMEAFRERRKHAGFRILYAQLPEDVYLEFQKQKRPGETVTETIKRLLGYGSTEGKVDTLF